MSTFYTNYKNWMKEMIAMPHPNATTWQTLYGNSSIPCHHGNSQMKHFTLSLIKQRDYGTLRPMPFRHFWDFKSWRSLTSVLSCLVRLCGKNSKWGLDFMSPSSSSSQIIQKQNCFRLWPKTALYHIQWNFTKLTASYLPVCFIQCAGIWMNWGIWWVLL